MITSNLPFSQWERIFQDPMTTAAAIDRLVHHCIILELNIASYRMEEACLCQHLSVSKGQADPSAFEGQAGGRQAKRKEVTAE
jgi:hypothetical protein